MYHARGDKEIGQGLAAVMFALRDESRAASTIPFLAPLLARAYPAPEASQAGEGEEGSPPEPEPSLIVTPEQAAREAQARAARVRRR